MRLTHLDKELSEQLGIPKYHIRAILKHTEKLIHKKILFGHSINIAKVGTIARKVGRGRRGYDVHQKKIVNRKDNYILTFKRCEYLVNEIKKKPVY